MLHFGELEPGDPQMRDRLQSSLAALTGRAASASAIQDAGAKLSEERTVKLPQVHNWGGAYKSAEFVVALAPGVVDAKFVSGAQELKPASAALGALKSSFPFPDDHRARVVRRGVLSCSAISKGCIFVFYPANVMRPPVIVLPREQPWTHLSRVYRTSTIAGYRLAAESVRLQASVFPVGTLVPLCQRCGTLTAQE